ISPASLFALLCVAVMVTGFDRFSTFAARNFTHAQTLEKLFAERKLPDTKVVVTYEPAPTDKQALAEMLVDSAVILKVKPNGDVLYGRFKDVHGFPQQRAKIVKELAKEPFWAPGDRF